VYEVQENGDGHTLININNNSMRTGYKQRTRCCGCVGREGEESLVRRVYVTCPYTGIQRQINVLQADGGMYSNLAVNVILPFYHLFRLSILVSDPIKFHAVAKKVYFPSNIFTGISYFQNQIQVVLVKTVFLCDASIIGIVQKLDFEILCFLRSLRSHDRKKSAFYKWVWVCVSVYTQLDCFWIEILFHYAQKQFFGIFDIFIRARGTSEINI